MKKPKPLECLQVSPAIGDNITVRVLAALSGGVDSAVAAARMVDAGHEVVGVHLALSRVRGTLRAGSRGCCTIEDSRDAYRACDVLGIPYYTWDFSERFKEDVIDDFVAEYAAGRTPNPCMRCNERIKFAALVEKALNLGFEAIATGHYAQVVNGSNGGKELHRAVDTVKDQSYVLSVLTAEQLKHCVFPLGNTVSKADVRAEARNRGLAVAGKPDSHDICFIPDGDTRGWLAEHIEMRPGKIIDEAGQRIGEHEGAHAFTVGQRRGLRLGCPTVDGKPRFVLEIRPKQNTVVVGPERSLQVECIRGIKGSWVGSPPEEVLVWRRANAEIMQRFGALSNSNARAVAGNVMQTTGSSVSIAALVERGLAINSSSWECSVQLHAHGTPHTARARAELNTDGAEEIVISLKRSARRVAPGQTAVMYQGSRVLGQATISKTYTEKID